MKWTPREKKEKQGVIVFAWFPQKCKLCKDKVWLSKMFYQTSAELHHNGVYVGKFAYLFLCLECYATQELQK